MKCLLTSLALICASSVYAVETAPMLKDEGLFKSSTLNVTKKYSQFDWFDIETDHTDLTLYGKKIESITISPDKESAPVDKALIMIKSDGSVYSEESFQLEYTTWGKLLNKSFGKRGKRMPSFNDDQISTSRYAWNLEHAIVVLSKRMKGKDPHNLTLDVYRRDLGLAYLKNKGKGPAKVAKVSRSNSKHKINPKDAKSKQAYIKAKIKEIMARPAPKGISAAHKEAINTLNVYRFLCGVSYNVGHSASLNSKAQQAAAICKKKGTLSHGFGHYTDECNLAMNSGHMTMASTVGQYINDSGDNNRQKRGHRRWCLYPQLSKSGFGIAGSFSAMHCFDHSGSSSSKNFGYPGIGHFPIDYLHGNAWSYYLAKGNMPADVKVEVYKLKDKLAKPPGWSKEPVGKKLPVAYKHVYSNTVNFEPQSAPVTRTGCYLVRLKGSGLKKQYIVNLF